MKKRFLLLSIIPAIILAACDPIDPVPPVPPTPTGTVGVFFFTSADDADEMNPLSYEKYNYGEKVVPPANPVSTDPAFDIFLGWSEKVYYTDEEDLVDFDTYELPNPNQVRFVFFYGQWDSSYVPPVVVPPEDMEYYLVGDGAFMNGGTPWDKDSGILLDYHEDPADAGINEYMALQVTFDVGDQFKLLDANGEDIVITNYRDRNPQSDAQSAFYVGDMSHEDNVVTVNYAGTYDLYLKVSATSYELWVSALSIIPDGDGEWVVVGDGSFLTDPSLTWNAAGGVPMVYNENSSFVDGEEYMLLNQPFEQGDTFKICSWDGATWVNSGWETTEGSAFAAGLMTTVDSGYGNYNAVVEVTGNYDIYLKVYADAPTTHFSMWVVESAA